MAAHRRGGALCPERGDRECRDAVAPAQTNHFEQAEIRPDCVAADTEVICEASRNEFARRIRGQQAEQARDLFRLSNC